MDKTFVPARSALGFLSHFMMARARARFDIFITK
jgi:hypothetical protein